MKRSILNPDALFVKNQKKRIKQNNGFCPCKLEKNPNTKCPCKEFRDGQGCDCGQYIEIDEGDGQ